MNENKKFTCPIGQPAETVSVEPCFKCSQERELLIVHVSEDWMKVLKQLIDRFKTVFFLK